LNNQKTWIQSFFLQIWYASLIKLNWSIQLHNVIFNEEAILMHACIKKWKSPCHKRNPNVIPYLIQYVYVIPLWNAPKLKLLMIWSWHENSNDFFQYWELFAFSIYDLNTCIYGNVQFQCAYKCNHNNIKYINTFQFVISRIWQNFLQVH